MAVPPPRSRGRWCPDTGIANLGGIAIITGRELANVKSVKVGTKSAQFVAISSTQLLFIAPPQKAGTYQVTLTNKNGGVSQPSTRSSYRYVSLFGR